VDRLSPSTSKPTIEEKVLQLEKAVRGLEESARAVNQRMIEIERLLIRAMQGRVQGTKPDGPKTAA